MLNKRFIRGIVLSVRGDDCIIARGYRVLTYNIPNKTVKRLGRIQDCYSKWSHFRLTRRLFRAEITHLYHFRNDTLMCIAKKGIFRLDPAKGVFEKCCHIEKGSRPLNLCQADDGTIYYGEYCYNPDRKPMRVFQSKDNGDTWSVAYTFKEGEINHIHGIFNDPFTGRLWVATGDDDAACIFGYTVDGFKSFVKEYHGSQQYRVCVPLFTENEIVFATDSQYEQNRICSIDRKSGNVTDWQMIQGSGIYAVRNGALMMVSTTVEPSRVNTDKTSHLWYSFDGHNWRELTSFKKDSLPMIYFQFGSIRFPNYEGQSDYVVFHGRALAKLDGRTMIIPLKEIEK